MPTLSKNITERKLKITQTSWYKAIEVDKKSIQDKRDAIWNNQILYQFESIW